MTQPALVPNAITFESCRGHGGFKLFLKLPLSSASCYIHLSAHWMPSIAICASTEFKKQDRLSRKNLIRTPRRFTTKQLVEKGTVWLFMALWSCGRWEGVEGEQMMLRKLK